ncbi:methyltransferase domain-containing protein [Kaistia dalseonensis]|uniref:SAM-dependent methyltransferase n=1 Tax=Kaistia dalseonensis TaxID=410840 RepID=A0ABU0H4F4_9HYPH|nr:class I SAM-dependent methyltransferase [Kaistia dalseonensis]MCX5494603.1 methyltransferase domain-containing protein [Kaistia dalseonensis]MDQ0437183.1 SAM-dependent methyltransferase [Kaistia dalseonensis]
MDAFKLSNRKNWDERADIHAQDRTGFYAIDAFLAGEDVLYPIEKREIGDIAGLKLAHFQCHIGIDTLCLARRGAVATGLDFSPNAIAQARTLSERSGIKADFVEGEVYDAPELIGSGFDMVFTSWGTITWLDDIRAWARAIAGVLKPGGRLYFADSNPSVMQHEEIEGSIRARYDWRSARESPQRFDSKTTYTGDQTPLVTDVTYEWMRGLSDVIGALLEAGMRLDWLREHETLPFKLYPMMVDAGERMFRLPPGVPRMPLALSLQATRTG